MEVVTVQNVSGALDEGQPVTFKFCDRCARRSPTLLFDDFSLQELCQDCYDHLMRLHGTRAQVP